MSIRHRMSSGAVRRKLQSRFRAVAVVAFLCLLACSMTACCSKGGLGPVEVTAYEKVRQHAWNAMAFHFDRESDTDPLRQFLGDSADADDRQELIGIWRGIDPLGSDHPDLLQHNVFDKAMAEPGWPDEPVDEKAVFVAGTRDATADFLAGDEE